MCAWSTPVSKTAAHREAERVFVRVAVQLLVIAGGAAVVRAVAIMDERGTAMLAVALGGVVFAKTIASLGVRATRHATRRFQSVASALAALIVAVVPAWQALYPGTPIAAGRLRAVGDTIYAPPEGGPRVRVLVSADLPEGKETNATYALRGFSEPVEGSLERGIHRVTGRRRLSVHRPSMFHRTTLSEGSRTVSLQAWNGEPPAGLSVKLYADAMPTWLHLVVASLVVIGVAQLDHRLARHGSMAAQAGGAGVLGLVGGYSMTPLSAFAPAVAALATGWIIGSILGWSAARLMSRVRPRGT